jgi:RNA recognition motif-containing protein
LNTFEQFGVIGDFYRPTDTRNGNAKPILHPFAFVRYFSEDDAANACQTMHGSMLEGQRMTVEFAEYESRFSNSTGFITNYDITEPPRPVATFDPSMPASHREKKVEEWAAQVDEVYTLKVENLNTDISPERLREIFSAYGFISSIYYPTNLTTHKTRDFAMIRYIEEKDAREAQRQLDGADVGTSKPLSVFFHEQQRYFTKTPFVTTHQAKEKRSPFRKAIQFNL